MDGDAGVAMETTAGLLPVLTESVREGALIALYKKKGNINKVLLTHNLMSEGRREDWPTGPSSVPMQPIDIKLNRNCQ